MAKTSLDPSWRWCLCLYGSSVVLCQTKRNAHITIEVRCSTLWWSDKAIQRTTPLLMGLYSILILIAIKMNKVRALVVHETTSWYDKQGELTFTDIIVIVRREIWSKRYFSKSANNDEFEKFSGQEIEHLIYQLSLAA